ncbi:MAG: hypothetical protein U1E65_17380 [Myxococcota bacterium]
MSNRVLRKTTGTETTKTRSGGRMSKADAQRVASSLREHHGKKALAKLPKVAADVSQIRAKAPTKKELVARNAELEEQNRALQANVAALSKLASSSLRTHGFLDRDALGHAQVVYDQTVQANIQKAADAYYDAHGESLSDKMFRMGY